MSAGVQAQIKKADVGGDDAEKGKLTLLQAVAMNTMNMFGTGPLITIPYCIAAVDPMGPHAMLGYGIACIACMCDSMIWGEIGSMWPDNGGSYVYLRELYGRETWGRMVSFMFVWQFFISGPAEAASGFIAIAEYLVYFSPDTIIYGYRVLISLSMLAICFVLMARKITDIGIAALVMSGITAVAMAYTIISGFSDWHADYIKTPPEAFKSASKTLWIIAAATRFGVYDMTGYYDVCFMGGEVQNAKKTIPLSCVATCCSVAVIYILVYVAVLGNLPWTSFVDMYVDDYDGVPLGIMSLFTENRFNSKALAYFVTIVVCITIFGSTFAMLCGFVFIPVSAARDGYFFSAFAPKSQNSDALPVVSLCTIMGLTAMWCFFSLDLVIDAMTTMIVLVMFCGQSAGLVYYRYRMPLEDQPNGWRMPLFPLPCIIQFIIFFFIFITTDSAIGGGDPILELSIAFLFLGAFMFLARSKYHQTWPFSPKNERSEIEKNSEQYSV